MNLLPAYIDRIEKLALSDHHAPGQNFAFLSKFPSFSMFRQLRRLSFHPDINTCEEELINEAMQSLCHTDVQSLTVIIKENEREEIYKLRADREKHIVYPPNLRNLFIGDQMNGLAEARFPNLQKLTLTDHVYDWDDFNSILQNAPGLKYLNIQIYSIEHEFPKQAKKIELSLHTLIFKIKYFHDRAFGVFEQYLRAMPDLYRLEVISSEQLLDAATWQMIITQSLPSLTYFTLHVKIQSCERKCDPQLLASFETPFWIEKNNFHIIISESYKYDLLSPFFKIKPLSQSFLGQSVQQCWMALNRHQKKPRNPFRILFITPCCRSFVPHQQFDRVNYIVVNFIEEDIYQMIKDHIPTSQVRHLMILLENVDTITIASLLSLFPNLRSLNVPCNLLFSDSIKEIPVNENLRDLDILMTKHLFCEEQIMETKRLYPNLEHLSVYVGRSILILQLVHLFPSLRSLKYLIDVPKDPWGFHDDNVDIKVGRCEYRRRFESQTSFTCDQDEIILWLGEDVFRDDPQLAPNSRILLEFDDNDFHPIQSDDEQY